MEGHIPLRIGVGIGDAVERTMLVERMISTENIKVNKFGVLLWRCPGAHGNNEHILALKGSSEGIRVVIIDSLNSRPEGNLFVLLARVMAVT